MGKQERRDFKDRRKVGQDNQDSLKAFARTCVMLDNEKLKAALEESEKMVMDARNTIEDLLVERSALNEFKKNPLFYLLLALIGVGISNFICLLFL